MKEAIFIGWNRCSTCRNAKKFLDENNIEYTYRDMMDENPKPEELKKWISDFGVPAKRFFNSNGLVYREMGLKDKIDDLSEDEQIELLASTGKLIKRPLFIGEHGVLVGFVKEMYETLI
ncbi:MAG: arsenate reductase family protein [Erysipelothrix sp.]|nr:arsenate reductase family protein [Erysipelothrix sp.]